ncbi:hypothetical protein N4T20_08120 [Flavobacterium sp. TR2]|uniref:hypothetical protein n=1 Tax=Flavobacterium sp. TR2 TaxID=2977321 RepID=UPI0021B1097E|nr:hypothetical protein [Flavobacterium sp. TR2]UWY29899.1 hypothetical protein N4T20_08120 [Flavobacterium sp. TR2]
MTYNLRVKGNLTINVGGTTRIYAKEGVEINSNGKIEYFAESYSYGEPEDPPLSRFLSKILYVNGHFYNEDGTFEGKVNESDNEGNFEDVYTCTGKTKVKNEKGEDIITYNDIKILQENKKNITHSDFCYISYVIKMEAGANDLKELKCIAYASFNRSKNTKSTWKKLLSTSYSSVGNKKEMDSSLVDEKSKMTRKAVFYVLNEEDDLTNGAELWDGTDFLAWGNSETNPYNKLGQNKFDEYKFIEIPKDIYDSFISANGSSTRYGDKGNHKEKSDQGTHEHIKKKIKQIIKGKDGKAILDKDGKPTYEEVEVPSKIKYIIPASDFENKDYWISGNFYYETGVKVTNGISGTVSAGKSIFWKITKTRLTSETPVK